MNKHQQEFAVMAVCFCLLDIAKAPWAATIPVYICVFAVLLFGWSEP
jgi:hypothetical protein